MPFLTKKKKTLVKRKPRVKKAGVMKKLLKRELKDAWSRKLIEQETALDTIIPYLICYQAGLANETRPIGVFFLLGPTGSGKTETVFTLAEILHGDRNKILRIDCGQFTASHEVAKLIGAPPGYLGHKETTGMLTTSRMAETISPDCGVSLVLFDEIEKAHVDFFKILLSILDKGEISMGDNTKTNFRNSLVFFTSNLGAKEMQELLRPRMGFHVGGMLSPEEVAKKLSSIGTSAAKKKFTPEFFNRLDEIITYKSLSREGVRSILRLGLDKVRETLYNKTKPKYMYLLTTAEVEDWLIDKGFSDIYGARELQRTIQRYVVQPVAEIVTEYDGDEKLILKTFIDKDKLEFEILTEDYFKAVVEGKN